MNEFLQSALYIVASGVFGSAAFNGIKTGRLWSIRGSDVRREEGPIAFGILVVIYFIISIIMLLSAFFWKRP